MHGSPAAAPARTPPPPWACPRAFPTPAPPGVGVRPRTVRRSQGRSRRNDKSTFTSPPCPMSSSIQASSSSRFIGTGLMALSELRCMQPNESRSPAPAPAAQLSLSHTRHPHRSTAGEARIPFSRASHLRLRPSLICRNALRSTGRTYGAFAFSQDPIAIMDVGPSSAKVRFSTPACPYSGELLSSRQRRDQCYRDAASRDWFFRPCPGCTPRKTTWDLSWSRTWRNAETFRDMSSKISCIDAMLGDLLSRLPHPWTCF